MLTNTAQEDVKIRLRKAATLLAELHPDIRTKTMPFVDALKFGHAEGYPGWVELRRDWEAMSFRGLSTRKLLSGNAFKRCVLVYSSALIEGTAVTAVHSHLDAFDEVSAISEPRSLPVDPDSRDPAEELRIYEQTLSSSGSQSKVMTWYRTWLGQVSASLTAYLKNKEQNALVDLVSIAFDGFAFPFQASDVDGARSMRDAGIAVQALVSKFISNEGYEIIEPIPGVDDVRGEHHEVEGDERGGKVGQVKSRGIGKKYGRPLRRAVVVVERVSLADVNPALRSEITSSAAKLPQQ